MKNRDRPARIYEFELTYSFLYDERSTSVGMEKERKQEMFGGVS